MTRGTCRLKKERVFRGGGLNLAVRSNTEIRGYHLGGGAVKKGGKGREFEERGVRVWERGKA